MKKILITLLLVISSFVFHAQSFVDISGKITDSILKTPLEYVSVRLYKAKDSSVFTGAFSISDGSFMLQNIIDGNYYLKFSFAGYKNKIISPIKINSDKNIDLGIINLNLDKALQLDEIKVTGEKQLLINNIDKKIYNVGEDISVKGGTVNDILNNIPSVDIDQEGKISLRGDGNVTILIDGRPSALSGANGKSFLDGIPASSIERIEIVNNPSSKYDPDGTSGIINIVLKKNKLKGINGNISLSASTGYSFNGAATLSVRNKKMNAYASYAYRYYTGERNYYSNLNRYLATDTFLLDQVRLGTDMNISHTAKVGSDFYFNERNTFGLSFSVNDNKRERTGNLNNLFYSDNILEREWNRLSSDPNPSTSFETNINHKIDFKKDKGNLIFDGNFSKGIDNNYGEYEENYVSIFNQQDTTPDFKQNLNSLSDFYVGTLQADLIYILPKNFRLESGAKAIMRQTLVNSTIDNFDNSSESYIRDSTQSFDYQYDEKIYSTYVTLGNEYKKWKYQGGVRFERASQLPNLISQDTSFNNIYYNLFPSLFLKYAINKPSELSFSYSKRINRASSDQLNPFTNLSDPFNLRRGNPSLDPEYIHSFEFAYSYNTKKINITTTLFYRQTSSVISRVKYFYDDGTTAVTYGNIDKSISMGPEIVLVYKPTTWLKNVISMNGNSIQYFDDTPDFNWNNSGFFWSAKYVGTIDLWKKTASLQINGRYNSPIITAQGKVQPRASMDLAFDKNFKNNAWSIGFRLEDVFNTREFRLDVEQPTAHQIGRFKQNTRRFFINLSYKFGKFDVKKSKSGFDGGGGMDF